MGVVAAAFAVRAWNLLSLGYQHWDEYFFVRGATRLATAPNPGWYLIGYAAPPLDSAVLSIPFRIFGAREWLSIGLSVLWGTATVAVCYVTGRELVSPRAGMLAAAFCAASEFAVMYSRMALSDAMFAFVVAVTVYLVWRAMEVPSRRRWFVAGLVAGAAINTKFDGLYLVLLGPAYLVARLVDGLVARGKLEWSWSRWLAAGGIAAVAIATFIPFLVAVQYFVGLHQLYALVIGYSGGAGSPIKTSPQLIADYYTSFGSAALLAGSFAGVALALARRRPGDIMLAIAFLSFAALVMLYTPYPRLALPLVPLSALLASAAIDWAAGAAARLRPIAGVAVGLTLGALVLVPEAAVLPSLLAERPTGYRDAAAFIDASSSGALVFTHLQQNILLYTSRGIDLRPGEATAQRINDSSEPVYFVTDQTWDWDSRSTDFFVANRDRLEVVRKITNEMYPEVLLQPASVAKLPYLENPPNDLRYITVYRLTLPATIPDSWRGSP